MSEEALRMMSRPWIPPVCQVRRCLYYFNILCIKNIWHPPESVIDCLPVKVLFREFDQKDKNEKYIFTDILFSPGTVFLTEERKVGLRWFEDKSDVICDPKCVKRSSSSSMLDDPPANTCGFSRWPGRPGAHVIGGEREETWSPHCQQQINPNWTAVLFAAHLLLSWLLRRRPRSPD